MSCSYWKFRTTLDDRPGGLAAATAALAALGVNVLDVDVHLVSPHHVADDIIVELPYWAEPVAVERALGLAGGTDTTGRRLDPHELTDGQTRALDAAATWVRNGSSVTGLPAALTQVVDADVAWIGSAGGVGGIGGQPAADRAIARSTAVVDRVWSARLRGDDDGRVWIAAIPWGARLDHVACLARCRPQFSATELARVQSLLGLVSAITVGQVSPAAA